MPELDLSQYPFLAIHPLTDGVAIHLHDIADFHSFVSRWHKQDDKFHKHFGYDLPTVYDNHCATITDFRNVRAEDLYITEVRSMTFTEWMGLIEDAILRDD